MNTRISLIKKANTIERYTPDQMTEIFKCQDDPIYFIENYCKVIDKKGKEILFKLYPYQKRLLDSVHNNQYSVALFARQMGKTEAAVSYMLWFAMFNDNRNVLMAAHKFEHIGVIMKRIKQVYENLPYWLKAGVLNDGYNQRSIKFGNGSEIKGTATTATAGRGNTVHLLYIDEFAFVPLNIAKEFWASIQPTLASSEGKCIITSTPNTDDDEYAQIWHGSQDTIDEFGNEQDIGNNGFKGVFADWKEHPDRDEKWAAAQLASVGEERFRREYLNEFISFDETLLSPIFINDNLNKMQAEPTRKTGQVRWYEKIEPNKTYVIGLDPSLGVARDYSVIQVYKLPDMVQVAEWRHNKTRAKGQATILRDILCQIEDEMYDSGMQIGDPEIYWTVENNTIGETMLHIIEETGEETFPGSFQTELRKAGNSKIFRKGYNTTNKKKVEACSRMKQLLEESKMTISSKVLISELKVFVAKGNSFEAKAGRHDDAVSATLLCIRLMEDLLEWDSDLRDQLTQSIGGFIDEPMEPMPTLLL